MARPETPIDPRDGPLAEFAAKLRDLRKQAGLTYRELARRAHCSPSALSQAASGRKLPTWEVTKSFVEGCGGDQQHWRTYWQSIAT